MPKPTPGFDLHFSRLDTPELFQTAFRHRALDAERSAVRGKTEGAAPPTVGTFQWTRGVQAMAYFFVRCAAWARADDAGSASSHPFIEGARGSLASSLDMALTKKPAWLADVFGFDQNGDPLLLNFVRRTNPGRKHDGPVAIGLDCSALPPGNIAVFASAEPVQTPAELDALANRIAGPVHQMRAAQLPNADVPDQRMETTGAAAPGSPPLAARRLPTAPSVGASQHYSLAFPDKHLVELHLSGRLEDCSPEALAVVVETLRRLADLRGKIRIVEASHPADGQNSTGG